MLGVLYLISTAVLLVLDLRSGAVLLGPSTLAGRPIPWVAIGLTVVAIAGVIVQLSWSGAFDALADVPGRSGGWRPFTAVFLQNGGVFGVVFNLITLPLAVALAEWFWGRWTAFALFVVGMVGPSLISAVLFHGNHAQELGDNPRNFVGSSGATFLVAATVAGALVVSRLPGLRTAKAGLRDMAPGLAVAALGLVSWWWLANAHGLVSCYGFVIGAVLWLIAHRFLNPDRYLSPPTRRPVSSLLPASALPASLSPASGSPAALAPAAPAGRMSGCAVSRSTPGSSRD